MKVGIKRAVWAGVVLAVAAGGGWWFKQQRSAGDEQPRFRTAAIDEGAITQVVLATGALQAVTTVNIGTQVSGTVLERLADFNDRVKKGQVLLRLDPAVLQARLRQARAQLAASEATLVLARATLERNQRLVAQGFISALALDQSRREADAGTANVELARAQVDSAQTDLDNSVIRSPIDGVVIRRNTDVGQTVAASFQTPDLYLIARDLRDMLIATNVSEADVGLIRNGQPVRFTVDAYPEREFQGTVQQFRLNSASNQGVVTYTIMVAVANADELLKPGMTAQTRIVVASKDRVTRLPTAALRFRPDEDQLKAAGKAGLAASAASSAGAASAGVGAASAAAAKAASAAEERARADDDGVLSSTRGGAKVYRVYTVGDKQVPKLHEVTIGISNTRFTELVSVVSGSLKPGDPVITRKADSALPGKP
jgi:HlyD family secretion protein